MALGDKVEELQKDVATLWERLDTAVKTLGGVIDTQRRLADMLRDVEKESALLKREVEELRKWKDDQKKRDEEFSRRLWAFGPNLLGEIVGGLIAAAVTYFIARR